VRTLQENERKYINNFKDVNSLCSYRMSLNIGL